MYGHMTLLDVYENHNKICFIFSPIKRIAFKDVKNDYHIISVQFIIFIREKKNLGLKSLAKDVGGTYMVLYIPRKKLALTHRE